MSSIPITFSIPACKIVNEIPLKTKLMSSLIPGNANIYIYNTEEEYNNEYQSSMFAITTKKGGWDCLRHYEIMASGTIPYFPYIEKCPPHTLALLPKNLLIQGNQLYDRLKRNNKTIENLTTDELNECNTLITKLLNYTKSYLTTKSIAKYMLIQTNYTNVSKVLYLSGKLIEDYLICLTLHGFKELMGSNCHDYPKIEYIYKSPEIEYNKLYGKGFTYSNLLDQSLNDNSLDKTIIDDIKNKKYDIIIYSSFHRGMPFFNLVSKIYEPKKIIMMCGDDIHFCQCSYPIKLGHPFFMREIGSVPHISRMSFFNSNLPL
jgi:hypothetical protein